MQYLVVYRSTLTLLFDNHKIHAQILIFPDPKTDATLMFWFWLALKLPSHFVQVQLQMQCSSKSESWDSCAATGQLRQQWLYCF